MHPNSMRIMADIIGRYMPQDSIPSVLDVGSLDVNGSYRLLFAERGCPYVGVDIEAGKNVDVVMTSHDSLPLDAEAFDWVVSGQCFEHAKHPWLLAAEMGRVCKPGGIVAVIAPMVWCTHQFPIDCWRFLPEGLCVLLKDYAQCDVLRANFSELPNGCKDAFAVGRRRKDA